MNYSTLFKIVSFIPIVNLISLLILILHSYILFGHFPTYSNPDPKTLNFTYQLLFISQMILIFSFLYYPYLIFKLFYFKDLNRKVMLKNVCLYLIGFILLLVIFRMETYNLGEWIAD